MKRLKNALDWPGGHGWLVLVIAVVAAVAAACTTPSDTKEEPREDEVIGKPPSAEEDPFFVERMPGEAVPVAPSGSISEEEAEEQGDSQQSEDPQSEEPKETDEPATAKREQDEPAEQKPEPAEPGRRSESKASRQPQCFSCVRICPAEGDCDDAKEDVICGWGVHADSTEAKRMAKAECDATLNMARQMPVWSEIAGECPAATCR